jgi:lipopolysaccharide export system protein LptA
MKTNIVSITCISLALAALGLVNHAARAQEESDSGTKGESATVSSDSFKLDLQNKQGLFSGKVHVQDPRFELDAEEMIVFFTKDDKLERLVAKGKVRIKHGQDRSAVCKEAEYIIAEKKIKLTGDPVVSQGENRLTGNAIVIYPDTDRMEVDGRSKVQFFLN